VARMTFIDRFVTLLNEVDLVTFDVFDTALVRGVARPVDLFLQLAEEAHQRGLLSTVLLEKVDFSQVRQAAENEARRVAWENHGWTEIRHEEIYVQLAVMLELDSTSSRTLMELERQIELAHVFRNAFVGTLYEMAKQAGKQVGFVSDMYLDERFVNDLLRKAGYVDHDFLWVSCTTRETKAAGVLYQAIHAELGVPFDRWLHIGDNLGSDVLQAQSLGIKALHYEKCVTRLQKHSVLRRRLGFQSMSGTPARLALFRSIIGGLIAARQFVRPEPDSDDSENKRFWEDWGYRYAGPLLVGFGSWLVREIDKRGFSDAYFLARDGYLIQKVVTRLMRASADGRSAFRTHYLYASRRAFNLAAINELNDESLDFLVSGTSRMSIRQFLGRIDIDIDQHLDAVERVGFTTPDDIILDGLGYGRLRTLLVGLGEHILARAREEFETLACYFNKEGLLDAGEVAIIDLGWHGSLQHSLDKLLRNMGATTRMTGYYMGTFAAARRYTDRGHELHGYLCEEGRPDELHEAIKRCVEIFEWIFSAPHGSVCNFRMIDNDIQPVFAEFDFEEERWVRAAQMQTGALQFIDDYVGLWSGQSFPEMPPQAAVQMLHAALMWPTRLEVRQLGDIQHAEGFGRVAVTRYIAKPEGSLWNPLSYPGLIRGYRNSFWRIGYLKRLGF
jgi:predicted HAD superfamily hydrolase